MLKAALQLIRIPDLLLLAFAQVLMRQAVIAPILQVYGFEPATPGITLFLLVAGTLCITAAGQIVNDYFGLKTDALNRPDRLVITRLIDKEGAMRLYQGLTIIGVACGLLLAYLTRSFTVAFMFLVIPGLLWFYASNYKRQFLVGNIVVAFCAGMGLLVTAITEMATLQATYGELLFKTAIPRTVYSWTGGFAALAFLLVWIKAILCDIENEPGDREMEHRTMPVKWGLRCSKLFLYGIIALTCAGLALAGMFGTPFDGTLTLRYIVFGQIVPLIVLAVLTGLSDSPSGYRQAITLTRFIMLTGMLYSLVFYYLQARTHGISLFGLFWVK